MKKIVGILFLLLCSFGAVSQTEISGMVYDEYLEPFPGATIKYGSKKTTSDENGEFTLKIRRRLPLKIQVSSIGYGKEVIELTSFDQELNFILKETSILDQVVVSASRTPERILESPVTVERYGFGDVRRNSSLSFYDGLESLKGVDINASSLGFKSVNTRGFAGFENARFVQQIDGMDNMIPALNFAMGNMAGSPDIDIESVEILPGAASALYGANAFNGILLMTTKNPFDYQGVTVQLGSGLTNQKIAGQNPLYDVSARLAHSFSDKFAVKGAFSYYKGEEWHANDTRSVNNNRTIQKGVGQYHYGYNGVNIYGDEVKKAVGDLTLNDLYPTGSIPDEVKLVNRVLWGSPDPVTGIFKGGLGELNPELFRETVSQEVSRTGYQEKYLTDYKAKKMNFNGALHYRPFGNDKLEVIWNSRINKWDNLYQGQHRYAQKDFFTQQHKFEIKGHDFFARAYYSQNDAGKSYDLQRAGMNINRLWYSDDKWFEQYAVNFVKNADLSKIKDSRIQSHYMPLWNEKARTIMDNHNKRLMPGTNEFNQAFNKVISDTSRKTGAMQQDQTSFWHADVQFDLKKYINWVEIIVGSSYRFYKLNSFGTIFTDKGSPIKYDEHGTYLQMQKSILDKRLRLTGSIRYDKSTNYKGNYSPRVAVTYAGGKNRSHNFRFSYQTAFRNPTAQEQYMGLTTTPRNHTLGTVEDNILRYRVKFQNLNDERGVMNGADIFERGLLVKSVADFKKLELPGHDDPNQREKIRDLASKTLKQLDVYDHFFVKQEQLKTFELGYRGLLNLNNNQLLELDVVGYYNTYKNLITEKEVIVVHMSDEDKDAFVENSTSFEELRKKFLVHAANSLIDYNDFERFAFKTNSGALVNSWGTAIGLKTKFLKNFDIGVNYSYTDFKYDQAKDPEFRPNFNTPKHKVKMQFGNRNIFKNFGFNVQARWQDEYYWQSPFLSGQIPARTMVDAQINYRVPSLKSRFKLGGTNLLGKEYFSAPGTGAIGSMYYLTWIIND